MKICCNNISHQYLTSTFFAEYPATLDSYQTSDSEPEENLPTTSPVSVVGSIEATLEETAKEHPIQDQQTQPTEQDPVGQPVVVTTVGHVPDVSVSSLIHATSKGEHVLTEEVVQEPNLQLATAGAEQNVTDTTELKQYVTDTTGHEQYVADTTGLKQNVAATTEPEQNVADMTEPKQNVTEQKEDDQQNK